MAKKPVKIVFRTKKIIMIMVLIAVVSATIAVVTMQTALRESKSQYELMRQQAAALENANEQLQEDIDGLGTIDSSIQIAEDELGLVLPGTVIFTPVID